MARALFANLLWIDGTGGLVAGAIVVPSHQVLAGWYGLPVSLVLAIGVANLLYGAAAFTLATRQRRPLALIGALAGANATWAAVCGALVATYAATAGALGVVHLVAEGLYVGGLGVLEWRHRRDLMVRLARA
jgi:hypothetical protein